VKFNCGTQILTENMCITTQRNVHWSWFSRKDDHREMLFRKIIAISFLLLTTHLCTGIVIPWLKILNLLL